MNTEQQRYAQEIESIFRSQVETATLIEAERLRVRTEQIFAQWIAADPLIESQEGVVRAFLLAAWELHPLPPRLERQLAALESHSSLGQILGSAAKSLPHKLVEEHWNLVRKAAGRYHVPTEVENEAEFQELLSVGREALFVAAQKFYRRPRGNFKNFAWTLLREKMRDEQARRHPVPAKTRKKLAALSALRESYRLSDKTLDREAIASELKLAAPEVLELLQVESIWGNGLEFETNLVLEDLEAADQSLDQLSMLLEIEDADRLEKALAHMEGIERQVIHKLYFEEKSLRQVAEELQMSLPAFKKLHKKALTAMRFQLDDELEPIDNSLEM